MSKRRYCSLCGNPRPYRDWLGKGWTTWQQWQRGKCYTGYFCPNHHRDSHDGFMEDWIDGKRVPWIERQDHRASLRAERAYQE